MPVREYILRIIIASMLCSALANLMSKGKAQAIFKMVCGMFLLVIMIRPLTNLSPVELENVFLDFKNNASECVSYGEQLAKVQAAEYIKTKSEAYILNKAAMLGADIRIEIQLDESNIPCSARVMGEPSAMIQDSISQIIETDLGITKERQEWSAG